MTIQLDLFAMAAADEQAERETHGIPTLYAFESDDLADYDRVFDQWQQDWGRFNSIAQSHAWRFAISDSFYRPRPLSGCQPVIMHASTSCHHHRWTERCMCVGAYNSPFRARCRGCTWHSELVATETDAVLAALDHTHPGWRQAPSSDHAPSTAPKNNNGGTTKSPASTAIAPTAGPSSPPAQATATGPFPAAPPGAATTSMPDHSPHQPDQGDHRGLLPSPRHRHAHTPPDPRQGHPLPESTSSSGGPTAGQCPTNGPKPTPTSASHSPASPSCTTA